jgi:predicted DNA-binding transcriptional regulator YafY
LIAAIVFLSIFFRRSGAFRESALSATVLVRNMGPAEGPVSKISKAERQMNLVSMLLASRIPVPLTSILGSVAGYDDTDVPKDTLEKRFDRDRKELRAIGLDVEYHPLDDGIGGYTIDRRKNLQRPLKLTPAEATLLSIAGRIGAAATGGGALHEALKSALRKLAVDTPGRRSSGRRFRLLVSRERRARTRPGTARPTRTFSRRPFAESRPVPFRRCGRQ